MPLIQQTHTFLRIEFKLKLGTTRVEQNILDGYSEKSIVFENVPLDTRDG